MSTNSRVLAALGTTVIVLMMVSVAFASVGSDELDDRKASALSGPGSRTLTIGTGGLDVMTLNPFLYTMLSEYMTIWPCYSTVLTLDEDGSIVGDLAVSWQSSVDGLVWDFELANNAYFYNSATGLATVPVTAHDVVFSIGLCLDYSHSLSAYFQKAAIKSVSATGTYDLRIELWYPYAPLPWGLAVMPVLPQYIWSVEQYNWNNYRTSTGIPPCVGSGPFYYALPGLPTAGYVELRRNPTWFQTENKGWHINVDRLIYRAEVSADAARTELLNGVIDVYQYVPPSVYQSLLPLQTGLQGFAQNNGFLYEYNLNQMTDEMRANLGQQFRPGTNNQLLLDPAVKLAFAQCVDKTQFVATALNGYGSPADSLVPDINPWHYTYGSVPGEQPVTFDPLSARNTLYTNGWSYRMDGSEILPGSYDYYSYYPLCKIGGTDPLVFRFVTLAESPEWYIAGQMLANWAAQGGIDLWSNFQLVSTNYMNAIWYSADYDVWLWNWVMSPVGDPSTEIMSVLTTQEIGSTSDVFYSDPLYDDIWEQSVRATDSAARRLLTDELQRMAYESMACQCVAYQKTLYVVSSLGGDHWQNYGNWESQYLLMPEYALPYLYMRVYPGNNAPPQITSLVTSVEGMAGSSVTLTGTATDAEYPLNYRWVFGDGSSSGWQTSPTAVHTYATGGVYSATFIVRETSLDGLMTAASVTVSIIAGNNGAPYAVSFVYSPSTPDTGTVVAFDGAAIDPEGDPLSYSWDFGDGVTASGSSVTHQFVASGMFTVSMYVTDGNIGFEPRPVSIMRAIWISPNSAPTVSVPDFPNVVKRVAHSFTVIASDPDSRDNLVYTWDWGDGSVTVTTSDTATHVYARKGVYTLTVTVSDQTGLPGHEVSDTGLVYVAAKPPRGSSI